MSEQEAKLIANSKHINKSDDHSNQEPAPKSKAKWYFLAGIIVILVIIAIVLGVVLGGKKKSPEPTPNAAYYNPYAQVIGTNQQDTYDGYIIADGNYNSDLHSAALLSLYSNLKDQSQIEINPHSIPEGVNNRFIKNISFQFSMTDYKVGHMVLTDALNERYAIPNEALNTPQANPTMRLEMFGFQLNTNPFSFSFTDVGDKDNVFITTQNQNLVFMDKYIQMDFQLPSQRIFGFGERIHEFRLGEGTWTMWAKGQDSPIDDGTGGHQVYGVHPFILVQGKNKGDFFGMFFKNSNAQSPILKYNTDGTSTLSYITTGGMLEAYFFLHGNAKSIIQQYQNAIGHPTLPPFWALGWHQASWAYQNQSMIEDVVEGYSAANIPLETIWLDIPYLDGYADFTVNSTAFPDIKNYTEMLHSYNKHLICILDAGISADDLANKYYLLGQQYNTFIQSAWDINSTFNGSVVQKVWPNHTVFPDWFNPNSSMLWNTGLEDLYELLPFDGLWLDMNEATGFCRGECYNGSVPNYTASSGVIEQTKSLLKRFLQATNMEPLGDDIPWFKSYDDQSENSTYYLPFIPGFHHGGNLDNMSISLNATHPSLNNETEYNLHNLYGLMMAKRTYEFLVNKTTTYPNSDRRPFILTRSTFSGSGQYASHWLGDNWRHYDHMNYSIAGIMNMNMFGIPLAGADVCGFFGGDRNDELCGRWIQLATFYPFARAHYNLTWNGEDNEPTEPFRLAEPWQSYARNSIYNRYQFLRHLYTCLFEVSQWGGSCFDPLFYYYPEDDNLFDNIEHSFIVGGALKVSPILNPNITNYTAYFPNGTWVSLRNFSEIINSTGEYVLLNSYDTVNVHLKPGSLIPFQNNSDHSLNSTTALLEQAPITIIANRDYTGFASGSLLLDNGDSIGEMQNGTYEYLKLTLSAQSLKLFRDSGNTGSIKNMNARFQQLVILNAADIKDADFACALSFEGLQVTNLTINYNDTESALYITPVSGSTMNFTQIRDIHYGNSSRDFNFCDQRSYQYAIAENQNLLLNTSTTTFNITHKAGVLPNLTVTLSLLQKDIVNFQWTLADASSSTRKHFEVDIGITKKLSGNALSTYVTIDQTLDYFNFEVKYAGSQIYQLNRMVFDAYLIQLDATVTTLADGQFKGIWGIGERTRDFFYIDGVYTTFARDAGTPYDSGIAPGQSMYGVHPIYFGKNNDQKYFGVFNLNAAASDWYIKNNATTGEVNVNMMSIGGVVDLYIMMDISPEKVIQKYHSLVGNPVMIPQWGLGWHQCKWGYIVLDQAKEVVENYSKFNLPLDVMWSDIDYLDHYRDFTYDTDRYNGLPQFIDDLHNKSMHYVPILDAGVARRTWGDYSDFTDGVTNNSFITINNKTFIGQVWPNDAAFPDFLSDAGVTYWKNKLSVMHSRFAFDGLWEDMNEASNFCDGLCYDSQQVDFPEYNKLPYIPGDRLPVGHAVSFDAEHANGFKQVDTHSLFGYTEVKATSEWFSEIRGERPFIISRSTFAGSGKYGSHWLGDNQSQNFYMGAQVLGIMMMNMFGIPVSGADICGFGGNTNPELCARWTVVGSFSPFSRNHNAFGSTPQEPYQFAADIYEGSVTYTDIMRMALRNRYHLIRYYYTQLYFVNKNGGTFYKPMFYEFDEDFNCYKDFEYNVMLGSSLKLSVQSNTTGQNYTSFYYPRGMWCNVFNSTDRCFQSRGQYLNQSTKAYDFYLHLREGYVVPMQNATKHNINTTAQLQDMGVDFHILGKLSADGQTWQASGYYYNDNGTVLNLTDNANQYTVSASGVVNDGSTVTIVIQQTVQAANYLDNNTCSAVNGNDYLGGFQVYNAAGYNLKNNYFVLAKFINNTEILVGSAKYDSMSDRVLMDGPTVPLCLSTVQAILFTKKPYA